MISKSSFSKALVFGLMSFKAYAGGFVEGTIISLGEANEKIENIQRGQEIKVCADEGGEIFCGKSVVTTSSQEDKAAYQITTSNGTVLTAALDQKW